MRRPQLNLVTPSILLILVGLVGLVVSLTGCGGVQTALRPSEAAALGCATQALQAEISAVTPAVLDALAGEDPNWRGQLATLAGNGLQAVLCSVGHLLFDSIAADLGPPRAIPATLAEIRYSGPGEELVLVGTPGVRLLVRPVADESTPSRRVLSRGRDFVRERLRVAGARP